MKKMKERVVEILVKVKSVITPHLGDNTLVSDGVLDSLDIMNLIMALENEFDIEIDPEDVLSENFESVDKMVELIQKCQS